MIQIQAFDAVLKKHEGIDGAYIEMPFDVEAVFGAKRVKVIATFDGERYRGSVVRMGGCYLIGVPKALRAKIGKQPGDSVRMTLEKDDQERTVELPTALSTALDAHADAKATFESLSFTSRREYAQWVAGAKQEETRLRRVSHVIESLKTGRPLK